ncbi:unnamed protein product [Medioppia subpectinata]|uniref:Uncharacterized protein n=1 Tax=Medioppia subpectinata TaxID=1979941 RepID=A0A7R9QDC3_9ACAR|nr:unnamed protein product [Medioppia subpectinata]CAG2118799.1 unnamed protein product [Medioppia subpectinata]
MVGVVSRLPMFARHYIVRLVSQLDANLIMKT